tara:strand:- start:434 stop:703 length:270 start_codon:yes stop_codon:yes gene_type:complete
MADFEKNIKKALAGIKPENFKPKSLSKKEKDLMRRIQEIGEGVLKKEMGGEVMDMTKSQPVGMMDGGKVKKMNMGGVVPGRGGKFKGMK